MMKKILSLMLCLALLFTISSPVYAEEVEDNNEYMEEEYQMEGTPSLLRWSNISSATAGLSVTGGTAYSAMTVQAYSKVTTIVVYTYIQKKVNGVWTNIYQGIDKINDDYIWTSRSTTSGVAKGYTYRLRGRIYAYVGTTYELVTIYSSEKSY